VPVPLFAPVAPEEKRVTKTIADVGFDRLGDALGGGLVAMLLMLTPNGSVVPMLVVALLLSIGSLGLAVWFRRGYVERLASGLVRSGAPPAPAADPGAVLNRASVGGLDLSQTIDLAALTQRIDLSAGRSTGRGVDLRQLEPGPAARGLGFNPFSLHAPLDHGEIEIVERGVIQIPEAGVEFAAFVQALHSLVRIFRTPVAANAFDHVHAIGGEAERIQQPAGGDFGGIYELRN